MKGQSSQRPKSCPFSIQILGGEGSKADDAPQSNGGASSDDSLLLSLMPASYRTEFDNLAPSSLDISCIQRELDLDRLHKVFGWLWLVGRPVPPRPLHHQLLLNRDVLVTERMDMHLVWTTGRIFLKPIPRFLLEPRFWIECLSCKQNCSCSPRQQQAALNSADHAQRCNHRRLHMCALGFLFSYAALICHESDFFIAKEKHLLPAEVKWSAWRTLVQQLKTEDIYPRIDARFFYGELRLSRLNKIYRLSQLRSYMSHWQRYGSFFSDNFAWLATATVYVAIVLTAMQVGLATDSLAHNAAFQSASYGFTVFSILGPLAATVLIILAFCYMFMDNWIATVRHRKKRLHAMQAGSEGL